MRSLSLVVVVGSTFLFAALAPAQDYSVLRINEVIADNETQEPRDVGGATVDMVEIYNSGTELLFIGTTNAAMSLALTDTESLPTGAEPWVFPVPTSLAPGDALIIFCDGNWAAEGSCELHAGFNIASDGSEPITLWGPVVGEVDGKKIRQIIDQVWLPPLRPDVSFGRFPDGAGPAPVPVNQVLETFHFYPRGTSTFGSCIELPSTPCDSGKKKRFCNGAENASSGGNLSPHVGIHTYSTNNPAAGEPLRLRAEVDDEKGPLPGNIARVEIVYRVNGGTEQSVAMTYDSVAGVQQGTYDCDGSGPGTDLCPKYFDLRTLWDGQIPGQTAGTRVEFFLRVVDAQGAEDTTPDVICPAGIGPCDRDFGGPGCVLDSTSKSCDPVKEGIQYVECRHRFQYKVAALPRAELATVVINEVVAAQDQILKDTTEPDCDIDDLDTSEVEGCPPNKPECCKSLEDFIELYNSSPTKTVDLTGLWLSDGPFNPRVWQFPPESKILPLEHLIVWLDRDGGQCPDKNRLDKPCFWECPDPTSPATQEYHTNFALDSSGDQVYLFDTEANGFGLVHGVAFGPLGLNHSLSLIPDGDRNGCWIDTDSPTPRDPNLGSCPGADFFRSDASNNCRVDLSDAIFTLNYLFSGSQAPPCPDSADADDNGRIELTDAIFTLGYLFLGSRTPPAPGPDIKGIDPTEDELDPCVEPAC